MSMLDAGRRRDGKTASVTRYCLGLPFAEERPLTPEEQARFAQMAASARRYRTWTRAVVWLWPLVFVAGLAIGASSNTDAAFVVSLVAILAVAPVLLIARDAKKRNRLMRASDASEAAEVFWDGRSEVWLVRLPSSGLIVASSGAGVSPTLVQSAEAIEVNARPAKSAVSPSFPPMAEAGAQGTLPRRALTPSERLELKDFARRYARRPSWVYLVLIPYVLFGFGADVARFHGLPSLLWMTWHGGLAIVATTGVYFGYRVYLRVRTDLRRGYVLEAVHDGSVCEFLPRSGFIWTVDGRPSDVRTATEIKSH